MWRTVYALLLTYGALAWAIISAAVCFFYLSSFWKLVFGQYGAFYPALGTYVVCFLITRWMLRVADELLEPLSGPFDASIYENAPRDTFYRDWTRYSANLIRNRRYALYARTRQWDKLRALEAEDAARHAVGLDREEDVPEPPHPRRTTMAHRVTFEENRRGARRSVASEARHTSTWRWRVTEDDPQTQPY